eukprot:1583435-Amphidinium_carterae.1
MKHLLSSRAALLPRYVSDCLVKRHLQAKIHKGIRRLIFTVDGHSRKTVGKDLESRGLFNVGDLARSIPLR